MPLNAEDSPSDTIQLACELIKQPSVTPDDSGCQQLLADRLTKLGFNIEHLRFGDVDNLWAVYGDKGPIFAFAGHTDVVPTGPVESWQYPPFSATITNGMLYGRGAADMKGSLAAMITACERLLKNKPLLPGRIAFLITSDEEGPAVNGTVKVMEHLQKNHIDIEWCLVGEPSSTKKVGDVIKNGRRGSLGAELTVIGKQGHVAYPHLAENPIHTIAPALAELAATQWDEGNAFFPPTTFQISNINSGTGASNVIPGEATLLCNFRFSTESTVDDLKAQMEAILQKHHVNFNINWTVNGLPFLTDSGALVNAAVKSIHQVTGGETELSTAGGTSDGRFIAPTGSQVVELGPVNETIHKTNECVRCDDLDTLSAIYEKLLSLLLPV